MKNIKTYNFKKFIDSWFLFTETAVIRVKIMYINMGVIVYKMNIKMIINQQKQLLIIDSVSVYSSPLLVLNLTLGLLLLS